MSDRMNWNAEALARLAQNAAAFGHTYVALKESLLREGVPVAEARDEARSAATTAASWHDGAESGDCPVCGGSGEL